MNSTYKNIILKRLKYIIVGLSLITILTGNAGVKRDGYPAYPLIDNLSIDNIYSFNKNSKDTPGVSKVYPGKFLNESGIIKSDSVNHYAYQAREMTPAGKSFNFILSIK